jgi:hypothetical protein
MHNTTIPTVVYNGSDGSGYLGREVCVMPKEKKKKYIAITLHPIGFFHAYFSEGTDD